MADNVAITAGTGTTVAFDDAAGVYYQKIKIADGAADGTAMAGVGAGLEATALRVTLATDSTGVVSVDDNGGALTVDGTVTANLSATDNAVLDAIVAALPAALGANGGLKVEGVASGTAVPVSVATIPSHAVTNAGTFAVQADITKIAGASVVVSGGTEATALRVTIATDSTGVLSVDDNGGALTVDGTVAVTNAGITTIAGAVSGTEMQVDVVAALPAGTNAIGKLAANSGVDIGDVDVTSISAGENHLGAVGGNATVVTVTPTLTVHATYVAGDYVGESATPMTFAACARVNSGTGKITGAVLIDYALQSVACELWLFDQTVTPPNDSAAWTISDADSLKCIGVIPFATYYASALNSVAPVPNLSIPFKIGSAATALFGCLVTRGAPAYASGDVSIRLFIDQD